MEEVVEMQPNKGALGKAFKKEAKSIMDQLARLSLEEITTFEGDLASHGQFQLV